MGVPDFQSLMRPVLDQYADGRERMAKDVREAVGKATQRLTVRVPPASPAFSSGGHLSFPGPTETGSG